MSSKDDFLRLYRDLPPREKARLWFEYLVEGTQVPVNLKAGMKDGERTEFDRGRFILSSVHMFGDLELSRIEAELREMNLRLALLDQVKWILGFSEHLHELLRDRVKAPLTVSEHAKLLKEADKERLSLHQLVEVLLEQPEYYGSPGPDTDDRYSAAWGKKEKELKALVASGQLKSEQTDGEVHIRWGDWCAVSGQELEPMIDGAAKGRVFPDEMAGLVEEMRRERADLGKLIGQPFRELIEDGDSAMTYMLTIIAPDLISTLSRPFLRMTLYASIQDHFSNELRGSWNHLASLERIFERIRDEEFGGHDIIASPILKRLEHVRLTASEFGSELAADEDAVEADEDYVDKICSGLVENGGTAW